MRAELLRDLRAQRAHIQARWEDLLRAERSPSPLANPDILVHLFDETMNELFGALESAEPKRRPARSAEPNCPCGRNPYLVYFSAGRQAVREALVLAQAAMPGLAPSDRDSAWEELESVYCHISRRQVDAFCAVCRLRSPAPAATPHLAAAH